MVQGNDGIDDIELNLISFQFGRESLPLGPRDKSLEIDIFREEILEKREYKRGDAARSIRGGREENILGVSE